MLYHFQIPPPACCTCPSVQPRNRPTFQPKPIEVQSVRHYRVSLHLLCGCSKQLANRVESTADDLKGICGFAYHPCRSSQMEDQGSLYPNRFSGHLRKLYTAPIPNFGVQHLRRPSLPRSAICSLEPSQPTQEPLQTSP